MKALPQRNRTNGIGFERRLVHRIRDEGWQAMRNPGSGAYEGLKGDIIASINKVNYLIEAKKSTTASISVKKEWLDKIVEEAAASRRRPVLAIGFQSQRKIFIMISLFDYCVLTGQKETLKGHLRFDRIERAAPKLSTIFDYSFLSSLSPCPLLVAFGDRTQWILLEFEDWVKVITRRRTRTIEEVCDYDARAYREETERRRSQEIECDSEETE